jgi:hypothetical protein
MTTISSKFFLTSQSHGPCAYYLSTDHVLYGNAAVHAFIDKDDDEHDTLEPMEESVPVPSARLSSPAVSRRRAHHEIIDVDELDDYPPSRRPRLDTHSSENPTSSDIIVLDSDDGGDTGASTRPRSVGELASSVLTSS